MKITEIRTIPLLGETPDSGWAQGTPAGENLHTLLEVHTDEGLVGLGSVYTSTPLVDAALALLQPHLIGESAIEPERVAEKLHQLTFWQGRGGSITHAISGIDIALWDLFGKATGQPVARLLGGYYRDRIKPYGSILFDGERGSATGPSGDPATATGPRERGGVHARLREKLQQVVARGFRAVKLGWDPFGRVSDALDEALVRTARETVGPDVEIMVDAGGSEGFWPHGYKWAINTARMLADYDVTWFEEALPPDDIEGFLKLREHSPVPITTGEVLTRRQSFRPWIERGAVDYIQPDATKVGGLSEMRRIAWMAHDHNVLLVPHGWNTAVGLAADLHLVAAMPVARWVEYLTPTPYIEEIVAEPFRLDEEGMLPIPTTPGLGIDWNPEGLARLSGGAYRR